MEETKTTYTIAGHQFVLRDQIAKVADFALWTKGFVAEAVKASPEASLAWAGVCLVLPILTDPRAAEQANSDGFAYVTSRLRYYVELEHLLWPQNLRSADGLKKEFEGHIVDLYQHILEFQLESVLRFYRTWSRTLWHDLSGGDKWQAMRSDVEKLEGIVNNESKAINTLASRQYLESLSGKADASFREMQTLLSIHQQQLDVLKEIAQNTETPINLPVAENALYDSAEDQDIPLCQEGTGVAIRKQIADWATNLNAETILWLSGPAGTGKSTISRTLAHEFARGHQLGASYFFRRGDEARNDTALFFPTIANQLVHAVPAFRAHLTESLNHLGNVRVEKKALEEQFKTLLQTPLSKMHLDDSVIPTKVIAIDALDECERYDHISRVLHLLGQLRTVNAVRFRVFITSRRAPRIVEAFEDLDGMNVIRKLNLNEEFYEDTKNDITTFLKTRFADVKKKKGITQDPWPSPEDLRRLVSLATKPSPLFVYAATLCRFIFDEQSKRQRNPKHRLEEWLRQCDDNQSQLNQIYTPILNELVRDNKGEITDDANQLLQILGAIILLATPLPAPSLAAILRMGMDDVSCWLSDLHAVLDVPTEPHAPIRLLHKSFSDFLLKQDETGIAAFRVDARETHAILNSNCIQRMNDALRQDICSIQEPGMLVDGIDKQTIDYHIPADLKYACLYWVHHLQLSGQRITNGDAVCHFFDIHLLHWLEVLSFLNKLSEGVTAIRQLLKLSQVYTIVPKRLFRD